MVETPIAELIVGITRDPQFGLVLTLGSGGIWVELLKDTQTLLIPCDRDDIEQAIRRLKSAPLLDGYRGQPQADISAAIEAVMAIQSYALKHADRLIELDVNPLLICAIGQGAYVADALIIVEPPHQEP